jgi:hypothetical protein
VLGFSAQDRANQNESLVPTSVGLAGDEYSADFSATLPPKGIQDGKNRTIAGQNTQSHSRDNSREKDKST